MAEASMTKPKSKIKKKKLTAKTVLKKECEEHDVMEEHNVVKECDLNCDNSKEILLKESCQKVLEKLRNEQQEDSLSCELSNELNSNIIKEHKQNVIDKEPNSVVKYEIKTSSEVINSLNVKTPSAPEAEQSHITTNSVTPKFHELRKEILKIKKEQSSEKLYPQLHTQYSFSEEQILKANYQLEIQNSNLKNTNHVLSTNKSIYPKLSMNTDYSHFHQREEENSHASTVESCLSFLASENNELQIEKEGVRAFTRNQLMNFYDISKVLKRNDIFINSFIQNEENIEVEELYTLILKYYDARQCKKASEEKLKNLHKKLIVEKENIWKLKPKSEKFEERCADKKLICYNHNFLVAELDDEMHKSVCNNLKDIREEIKSEYSSCSYSVDYFKLQIEAYIADVNSLSTFKDISTQHPVTGFNKRDFSDENDINILKRSISVLFCFQRKHTNDKEFLKEIQNWLKIQISLLLRKATLDDHLFILNHVLRCPAGIGEWATDFIQYPIIPSWSASKTSRIESPFLDHIINTFTTLLFPIREREKFLEHYKSSVILATGGEEPEDRLWVVVNSTEEDSVNEEMEAFDIWLRLKESDIIDLFQQIPFGNILRSLLEIELEDDKECCKIDKFDENEIIMLLSIATWLIYIFCEGFNTFKSGKFSDFAKLLGQYISDSVKHICILWETFMSAHKSCDKAMTQRLQIEFDQFLYRSVACILSSHRKEAWQYLVLPYKSVSPESMWNLAWLIVNWHSDDKITAIKVSSETDIISKFKDPEFREMVEERLSTLKFNEITYLVNGLTTMVISREQNEDMFVSVLTIVIFEISFVASSLREDMSKDGKQFLTSIIEKHPYVVSPIIKELEKNLKYIGKPSLFLFKQLPLKEWKPKDDDVNILIEWLLSDSLESNENQLARLIISNMNWGIDQKTNSLAIDIQTHRKIAISIVEAYSKFIEIEDSKSLIMWSLQQLNNLAMTIKSAVISETVPPKEVFISWVWEMLFSLRLHVLDYVNPPYQEILEGAVIRSDIYNIQQNAQLKPVYEGVKSTPINPAACYVAFMLTSIGHSSNSICAEEEGMDLFSKLIENKQYIPAANLLPYIMPFFFKNFEKLLRNNIFMKSVCDLLLADLTYLAYLKNIIYAEFPGKILQLISCIIKCQIDKYTTVGMASNVVKFWMQILIRILLTINKNEQKKICHIYFLLDELIKISFCNSITYKAIFEDKKYILKCLSIRVPSQGLTSALSKIFSGPIYEKQILIKPTSDFCWFAWYAAMLEVNNSETDVIWKQVLLELFTDTKMNCEDALKKIKKILPISFETDCLPIYKWYRQAIETPVENPLCPLMWQQFFIFYLQKIPDSSKVNVVANMKEKFFNNSELKSISSRLYKAVEYHQIVEKAHDAELRKIEKETSEEKKKEVVIKRNFHHELRNLYETFIKLMEMTEFTILPDKCESVQYSNPAHVATLLQDKKEPWMSFVDCEELKTALDFKYKYCHLYKREQNQFQSLTEKENLISGNILKTLRRYKDPQPPPCVSYLESPVSCTHLRNFSDFISVKESIESNKKFLYETGKHFLKKLSELEQLDIIFENKILKLNKNEKKSIIMKIPCKKGFEDENGCSGPALFQKSFLQRVRDEKIGVELEFNRNDHYIIYTGMLKSFPERFIISAVQITNCVKKLQNQEFGEPLFYYFMNFIEDDVKDFLPITTFVKEQLEILGKNYIKGTGIQQIEFLQSITSNSYIVNFLPIDDLFDLSVCDDKAYLEMFEFLVNHIDNIPINTLYVLLNKFNISEWLSKKQAPSHINQIIHNIGRALCKFGIEIDDDKRIIYKLYNKNLSTLLLYNFPDYYGEILQMLLSGTDTFLLNNDVWLTFMTSLGYCISSLDEKVESKMVAKYISRSWLSSVQISETLEVVKKHFDRKLGEINNLFDKYKYYLPVIYHLFIFLGHKLIHEKISAVSSEHLNSYNENVLIEELWKELNSVFEPWIMPCRSRMPWNEEENNEALKLFHAYCTILSYFDEYIYENDYFPRQSILPLVWKKYIERYSGDHVKDYIQQICQNSLFQLSWNRFVPQLENINQMNKLIETKIIGNITFVSNIFVKISWTSVINHIFEDVIENKTEILKELSMLIMKLAWEPSVQEEGTLQKILEFAENWPWHTVDVMELAEVVNIFITKCNPDCILKITQKNSTDQILLKFLRVMTCMDPNNKIQRPLEIIQHRELYVKTYIHLMKAYPYCYQNSSMFQESFHSLLQQISHAVNNITKPQEKFAQSCALMTSILSSFNDEHENLNNILIVEFLKWLQQNPTNYLILPCLHSACKSLSNMSHLVKISECCIMQYFSSSHQTIQDTLKYLMDYLLIQRSQEEEFIEMCLKDFSHLSLYIYLMNSLKKDNSKQDELLNKLIDWNLPKFKEINDQYEAKLILFWDKILEICLQQIANGKHSNAKSALQKFCNKLIEFGKDSSALRFFRTQPKFSITFKFLCRVIAAFIAVQIPDNGNIRNNSYAPGHIVCHSPPSSTTRGKMNIANGKCVPSAMAQDSVEQLNSLLRIKQYESLKQHIEEALNNVNDAKLHLGHSRDIVRKFSKIIYNEEYRFLQLLNC